LIIFDIFKNISHILSPEESHTNGILNCVIRELKHNYKKNHSIDELADLASLSKHYFQNLFKKTYGITPIEYLTEIRIKHAKFMLKNYNYSCNEISDSIGFNSPLYFSKVFKKYTGLSPTQYRIDNK
jgi:two-component system response regulator YesN